MTSRRNSWLHLDFRAHRSVQQSWRDSSTARRRGTQRDFEGQEGGRGLRPGPSPSGGPVYWTMSAALGAVVETLPATRLFPFDSIDAPATKLIPALLLTISLSERRMIAVLFVALTPARSLNEIWQPSA